MGGRQRWRTGSRLGRSLPCLLTKADHATYEWTIHLVSYYRYFKFHPFMDNLSFTVKLVFFFFTFFIQKNLILLDMWIFYKRSCQNVGVIFGVAILDIVQGN